MGEVPSVSTPCSFSLIPGCSLCLKCPSLTSLHCLGPSPTVTSTRKLSCCPSTICAPWRLLDHFGLCHLLPRSLGEEGRDPDDLVYTAALVSSMGSGTW